MLSYTYAMSIYAAKENVLYCQPLFRSNLFIRKALNHALERNQSRDYDIFQIRYPFTRMLHYKVHKLMKRGQIYLYNGGFHHSKIMMVDETFCTVGTANLNSRSLRYDYETNAYF